jgi:hypothetical protein
VSALAPLDENGVDCDHRDQRRWVHRLSSLVVTILPSPDARIAFTASFLLVIC